MKWKYVFSQTSRKAIIVPQNVKKSKPFWEVATKKLDFYHQYGILVHCGVLEMKMGVVLLGKNHGNAIRLCSILIFVIPCCSYGVILPYYFVVSLYLWSCFVVLFEPYGTGYCPFKGLQMRKKTIRNQSIMDVVGTIRFVAASLFVFVTLLWTCLIVCGTANTARALDGGFGGNGTLGGSETVGGAGGDASGSGGVGGDAVDVTPSEAAATEATLATLPSNEGSPEAAELISRMMEIPYVGTSTGRAISLQESLQGVRDQEGTRRVVRAYWRTLESICRFRTLAEHAERLRRFRPQPNDLAMIQYLRNDVEKQVRLATDTLYRDQMTLLGSMVSIRQVSRGNRTTEETTDAVLPLPSDAPLTGGYETLFDRFYRNSRGTLNARARLLHYLLPLHREVIEKRAEQVAAAEYVLQDAVDAYANGQTSIQTLLWATNESLRSREEFITSVFNYNNDIADYIFIVAPEMTGTTIVPRLIRSRTLGASNQLGLNLRSDATISLPPSRFDTAPSSITSHTVAKPVDMDDSMANASSDAADRVDHAESAAQTTNNTLAKTDDAKAADSTKSNDSAKLQNVAKLDGSGGANGTAVLPGESGAGPAVEPSSITASSTAPSAQPPKAESAESDSPKPELPVAKPNTKPDVPKTSPIFAEEVAPRLVIPELVDAESSDSDIVDSESVDSESSETSETDGETASDDNTNDGTEAESSKEESSDIESSNEESSDTESSSAMDALDVEAVDYAAYVPSVPVWLISMQDGLLPPTLNETLPPAPPTSDSFNPTVPNGAEPSMDPSDQGGFTSPNSPMETVPTDPASSSTPFTMDTSSVPSVPSTMETPSANVADVRPLSPTTTPELLETVADQSQLYAALSSVTPGVRAKELAISLYQSVPVPIPDGVEGTAAPLSLLAAVEMAPKDLRGATGAYWLVALRSAQYRIKLQQQAWITTLSNQMVQLLMNSNAADPTVAAGGDPGVALRLHLAKATVAAELTESQIRLWDAQFQLAQRLGLPVDAAWPITATVPHHGPFEMFTDQQPETLVQSEVGRRLIEIIPGRYEYLVTLGDTVVEADASRAAAMSAAMQDPAMLTHALETIANQMTATSVFLEAIYGYNRAIADYAALVLPANLTAKEWVQTLVVTAE